MTTTGLFAGAKVSLGGVNITGKELQDYKPIEAAYIVGRYMQNNADGNLYSGSVSSVIYKLWPEAFGDYSAVTGSKIAKKIYWALKGMGFRPVQQGEFRGWRLPFDLDKSYKDFEAGVVRTVEPSEVKYRCVCGEGPFQTHADFIAHRDKMHEKGETVNVVEMVTCSVCANDMPSNKIEAHISSVHESKICTKCGKVVNVKGLGGHMHAHKMSKEGKELLDALKQYPGLHPREYAELLGIEGNAVSARFAGLKKLNKARVEGNRQNARYYPAGHPKAKAKPSKPQQLEFPKPTPEPVIVAPEPEKPASNNGSNIPGAEEVTIIETKDGTTLMFRGGSIYVIDSVTKLANV